MKAWQVNRLQLVEAIRSYKTCGAKNRRGTPCKIVTSTFHCKNGKYRCRYHGGLSTGPKTLEGKARSTLNLPIPGPGRGKKSKLHDACED